MADLRAYCEWNWISRIAPYETLCSQTDSVCTGHFQLQPQSKQPDLLLLLLCSGAVLRTEGCWPQSSGCWPCALRKPQESANSDQVRGLQEYVPSAVGVEAPYPALGQRMPCLLNPSLPKLSLSMSWPSISVHPQPQLHLQFQRCLVLGCLIVIVPQTNLQYRK